MKLSRFRQSTNQRYALATLFYSSRRWDNKENWLIGNECTSVGMSCNTESHPRRLEEVRQICLINISANGNVGAFPADFGLPSSMTKSTLSMNSFRGYLGKSVEWDRFRNVQSFSSLTTFSLCRLPQVYSRSCLSKPLYISNLPNVFWGIPSIISNLERCKFVGYRINSFDYRTCEGIGHFGCWFIIP